MNGLIIGFESRIFGFQLRILIYQLLYGLDQVRNQACIVKGFEALIIRFYEFRKQRFYILGYQAGLQ